MADLAVLTDSVLASVITRGDLSGLPPAQKAQYYAQLCERVGLDPATTPFLSLKLQGKEILYASKGAAEQLRKLHKVSVTITARERLEDVYYVTARATMPDGRTDESQGAVSIAGAKGETLANAIMKAETKAKRRVTLSIIGLGMLDESELDTIPKNAFEHLPQEPVRSAAVVSIAPPAKVDAKPAPEERRSVLPDTWEPTEPIPAAIRLWLTPLSRLGSPVSEMGIDELELVAEQCANAFERTKNSKRADAKQILALLNAIGAAASRAHHARLNDGGAA